MPPRDAASASREAEKKRGLLGTDANLGEAAVTRVRELLHRRGARDGSGSTRDKQTGSGKPTRARSGARARAPSEDGAVDARDLKPKRAAKNHASAHNARVLAAASAAADLATNSGKANAVRASHAIDASPRAHATSLENAAGTCGAAAAGTSASLDRANVAAVAAAATVAAVAAAAERGRASDARDASDSLRSVSSDEDSDEDEWEDVGGDFDAYIAPEEDDDVVESEMCGTGKKGKSAPRRVSSADRQILRRMHETHLLCLMARAAATNAAASDPLVSALAVSIAPRGVALADAERPDADGSLAGRVADAPPSADRVARLAKWFAGAFECRAASFASGPGSGRRARAADEKRAKTSRESRDANASRRRKRPKLEPLSRFARVKAVDDVIVIDDDGGDDDAPAPIADATNDDTRSTRSSASTSPHRHLADACVTALVPPRLRLAFACARRRGTQEDLVGAFVAAARGMGLVARVVAAFDPTPHRASASELEKVGVAVGAKTRRDARAGDSGSSRKKKSRTPSLDGGSLESEGPRGCFPAARERGRANADPEDALARERVAWWAEVLCVDETGADPAEDTARWVPVVPHGAGTSRLAPRWSFRAGGALVDDARALRGASPYVFAFGAARGDAPERRVVATDVTRKYAEAFSRCVERRVDPAWVAETTRKLAARATSPAREMDAGDASNERRGVAALVARADARDAREMDARARTERVPSTLNELKNHPLYACERFLRPNQVIFPRKPVVGFVNGECVFPRACVSELRSAERWKSEARREVLPEELAKPRARTHSRASRAAAAFAARRAEAEAEAARRAGDDVAEGDVDVRERKRRRPGPRSVEEAARDAREAEARRVGAARAAPLAEARAASLVEGDIPLFGFWQTREWRPPRAENGVVPKNARGNVDLIGAHALPPPGTAHVSLPRIARVARALRDAAEKTNPFDFAPALVGFEYRRGGATLPKFDGVVVCTEQEPALRAAWRDAENARARVAWEKDTRRAKRRWRVLLSAVWTRRALRDEFFAAEDASSGARTTALADPRAEETRTTRGTADATTERRVAPRGETAGADRREFSRGPLAVPATGLRSGRVAVVEGGAEAEVEAL